MAMNSKQPAVVNKLWPLNTVVVVQAVQKARIEQGDKHKNGNNKTNKTNQCKQAEKP
eukprot:m.151516 g.151516  ORF g.151516 m.151516 type:complete len:57 (+) comp16200_c7_seq1:74-244(+)